LRVAKHINFSTAKAVFGFDNESNIGQIFYRGVIQLAQILLPQTPEFGGPKPTLIPVGIDQHPYVLLARDVAKKLNMIPPSELVVRFQPSLLDPEQKMSGSKPNTAIYLNDGKEIIQKKINRAYTGSVSSLEDHRKFGAVPEICPVFTLLQYHHPDDAYVENIYQAYKSGRLTAGKLKAITTNFIIELLRIQKERVVCE